MDLAEKIKITPQFRELPLIPIEPYRNDGWLSPDAKFTICNGDEHEKCAKFLISKNSVVVAEKCAKLDIQDIESESARFVIGKVGFLQFSHGKPNFLSTESLSEEQKSELIRNGFALPENITLEMVKQLPKQDEILDKISRSGFSGQTKKMLCDRIDIFYGNPSLGIKFQVFQNDKGTPKKEVEFLYSIMGVGLGDEFQEVDEGINYARASSTFKYRISHDEKMALIYNFIHHSGDRMEDNPLILEYQIIYQTKTFAEDQAKHIRNLRRSI